MQRGKIHTPCDHQAVDLEMGSSVDRRRRQSLGRNAVLRVTAQTTQRHKEEGRGSDKIVPCSEWERRLEADRSERRYRCDRSPFTAHRGGTKSQSWSWSLAPARETGKVSNNADLSRSRHLNTHRGELCNSPHRHLNLRRRFKHSGSTSTYSSNSEFKCS